jgi:hypothetical protein
MDNWLIAATRTSRLHCVIHSCHGKASYTLTFLHELPVSIICKVFRLGPEVRTALFTGEFDVLA